VAARLASALSLVATLQTVLATQDFDWAGLVPRLAILDAVTSARQSRAVECDLVCVRQLHAGARCWGSRPATVLAPPARSVRKPP